MLSLSETTISAAAFGSHPTRKRWLQRARYTGSLYHCP
jgi:hypothetical protein